MPARRPVRSSKRPARRPATDRAPRRSRAAAERTTADFVRRIGAAERPREDADLARRDALVLAHADLPRRVAHRIGRRLPPHVDRADLASVGTIGLLEAAARYRPSTGVPFEAFARRRVQGAIMDALREMDWVPRSVRSLERKGEAAASILRQQLGREPSQEEVASRLGVTVESPALGGARHEALPGEPMQEAAGTLEQCPDPSESVEAQVLRRELATQVQREVQRLPEREQRVLDGYYHHELTMGEIGVDIGVCESRVSQLRSAAIAELRRTLASTLGLPVAAWTPVVLTGGAADRTLPARTRLAVPAGALEGACQAA